MDEGDLIQVVLKDENLEGILMPSNKTTLFFIYSYTSHIE